MITNRKTRRPASGQAGPRSDVDVSEDVPGTSNLIATCFGACLGLVIGACGSGGGSSGTGGRWGGSSDGGSSAGPNGGSSGTATGGIAGAGGTSGRGGAADDGAGGTADGARGGIAGGAASGSSGSPGGGTSGSPRGGAGDAGLPQEGLAAGVPLMLRDGWQVQTSTGQPAGATLSKIGFAASGWYRTSIPASVSGVLAQAGVYPDPFVGTNIRDWPGMSYAVGACFAQQEMSSDSPFTVGWWFRNEFDLPAEMQGRALLLHFEGINNHADIWLNGQRIADSTQVSGVMRRYAFDVTKVAQPGRNALALLVQPQKLQDLGHNWVDWAPMPPDKMLGLWRDVFIRASGVLRIRDPFVRSSLSAGLDSADLTVSMDLENTSDKTATGTVAVSLEGTVTTVPVSVAAGATQRVSLSGPNQPGLHLTRPRVWWPIGYGSPELYSLQVRVNVGDEVSDARTVRFGVREVTSDLTSDGYRRYLVNRRPVLLRGAGWARNMFFMETPKREEQEMRLVVDMGLNAVRFEGKLGSDHLLDLADQNGIFVIPGFCCCDWWEHWSEWNDTTKSIAVASFRDQLLLLRNHPSVLTFWYGSDKYATAEVEKQYLSIANQTTWPNPLVASAGGYATTVGPTGVKMDGPYDYEPPSYWYGDRDGAAFGFATEVGTGKAIPSVESIRRMLGDNHLWPEDAAWILHSQGSVYVSFAPFDGALKARYGAAVDISDYVRKAQLIAYDSERAMFEAYGRNKYKSTGVIKWMLNNAWPSLAWHLYDYYLEAGSGYYGTKKSLEPLHVQYSYDDRSIVVVNSTLEKVTGLTVRAVVLDIASTEKWSKTAAVDVSADGVSRPFSVPDIANLSKTYFLSLTLEDAGGKVVSRNFYWLSTVADVLDWSKRAWYLTPTSVHGDFTALSTLPSVTLGVETAVEHDGDDDRALVTLTNPGSSVAFFVRLRVLRGPGGGEILPSMWDDNYVSLLPGEARTLFARWRPADAVGATPSVAVDGWNVARK
jgi:exo-1,4-beta-D-glucosaminidase